MRSTCTPGSTTRPRRLARRVMASMPGDAPIVVNSAGCGAALKDYGHLLGHRRRRRVRARVLDVHEWLAAQARPAPSVDRRRGPVIVQDPCHLRHVQRAHLPVRAVARAASPTWSSSTTTGCAVEPVAPTRRSSRSWPAIREPQARRHPPRRARARCDRRRQRQSRLRDAHGSRGCDGAPSDRHRRRRPRPARLINRSRARHQRHATPVSAASSATASEGRTTPRGSARLATGAAAPPRPRGLTSTTGSPSVAARDSQDGREGEPRRRGVGVREPGGDRQPVHDAEPARGVDTPPKGDPRRCGERPHRDDPQVRVERSELVREYPRLGRTRSENDSTSTSAAATAPSNAVRSAPRADPMGLAACRASTANWAWRPPQTVATGGRFDGGDLGAPVGEQAGAERTGPHRRQVEDGDGRRDGRRRRPPPTSRAAGPIAGPVRYGVTGSRHAWARAARASASGVGHGRGASSRASSSTRTSTWTQPPPGRGEGRRDGARRRPPAAGGGGRARRADPADGQPPSTGTPPRPPGGRGEGQGGGARGTPTSKRPDRRRAPASPVRGAAGP